MDVVVSHVNADFDSLAGLVGAARLYPGAVMVLPGGAAAGVEAFLSLHTDVLPVRRPPDVEPEAITRVIVVDTGSRRRLGPAAEWLDLPGVEVHLYDHHPGAVDVPAAFCRVEPWGAVASILVDELRQRELVLTPVEATALLMGLYEDTGSLSFAGTRPEDLEAAAWLLRAGGNLDVVNEFTRHSLTPEQRRLFTDLIAGTEIVEIRGVPVALATAPPGPQVDSAATVVHRLMEAEDVAAAVILAPMEGTVYAIGRTRADHVDLGAVFRELGGGGHARAASAALKDADPAEVRTRVLESLERHLTPERTARELMSYPVRTIGPGDELAEAHRRMIRYGHSGLVVMEQDRMVGIVTRRDVDRARHHRLDHSPVRGVMTREVHTVAPDAPLSEMERVMLAERVGRLPVVRDSQVVGIVTRTDLLRALHGSRYLSGTRRLPEETLARLLRESLPARLQRLLTLAGELAVQEEARVYAVGGFVRDLLLHERNLDVDLLVEPDGVAFARAFAAAAGGELKTKGEFGTATVTLPDDLKLDFATARTESYARPGALPEVEPSSVVDDLRRRDFTINALAASLRPEEFGALLDPFGGCADLERRRIRVLHPLSFQEDPTRLFRAVRFEERYHFRMDEHTLALACDAVREGALARITPERVRRELFHLFREQRPVGALLRLQELGIIGWLAPGLELDPKLLGSLPGAIGWWASAAGSTASTERLYLAAILAGLPVEDAVGAAESRLRLPPPEIERLSEVLRASDPAPWTERLPDGVSPAAAARQLSALSPEALVLFRVRLGLSGEARLRDLLERYVKEWRGVRLAITGDDLKELGYRPGPALGAALRATHEALLNGEVGDSREAQLAHARAELDRPA